ncbi:flavin reductase family protein [Nocardia sp. NBC_00511]|uniref:flavin reductase family protein n=1 Tax=Nocardia sp. NBC_00511 TaxID=2903591 RepID=UPI0030E05D63
MTDSCVIKPPVFYPGSLAVLISTENADGTTNLAPMSSVWTIGETVMLGLQTAGQSYRNLTDRPDFVLNYPSEDLWPQVERLAPLTGADPVPPHKAEQFRTERDKFTAAGLTPRPADLVTAMRVAECPLQVECRARTVRPAGELGLGVVEAQLLRVHAHPDIVEDDLRHIRVDAWRPLFYVFRHYIQRGPELGRNFRAANTVGAGVTGRQ